MTHGGGNTCACPLLECECAEDLAGTPWSSGASCTLFTLLRSIMTQERVAGALAFSVSTPTSVVRTVNY